VSIAGIVHMSHVCPYYLTIIYAKINSNSAVLLLLRASAVLLFYYVFFIALLLRESCPAFLEDEN